MATAPDGTIYVAWQRVGAGGASFSLAYSASRDGGKTWSNPKSIGPAILGQPSEGHNNILAEPALSVLADGTVGIAFYDHRDNDITNLIPRRTDYRLRTMDASGTYLGQRHLAGPFDRSTAPDFKGRRSTEPFFAGGFIGDRQGMVPTESGFALSVVLASPLPDANFALSHEPSNGNAATDVFFIQAP